MSYWINPSPLDKASPCLWDPTSQFTAVYWWQIYSTVQFIPNTKMIITGDWLHNFLFSNLAVCNNPTKCIDSTTGGYSSTFSFNTSVFWVTQLWYSAWYSCDTSVFSAYQLLSDQTVLGTRWEERPNAELPENYTLFTPSQPIRTLKWRKMAGGWYSNVPYAQRTTTTINCATLHEKDSHSATYWQMEITDLCFDVFLFAGWSDPP